MIQFVEGQLPEPERLAVQEHLLTCELCSQKCARLSKAAASPSNEMLSRISGAIRRWSGGVSPQRTGPALRQLVAREIAPYLGSRASVRILSQVSESGDNLLSCVEPVLALFLGNRAAAHLVDRVVDNVLVRG